MMNFKKPFFIAGPCVIVSYHHLFSVAKTVKEVLHGAGFKMVLKSSFDKANRTSINSYRGPGLDKGISILHRVGRELDLPVTTDFHSVEQLETSGTTVDVVQIPAFLSRQTDILTAAARTGRPVNVKKGQFIAHNAMYKIWEKLDNAGCDNVMITERGTQFGHDDVVVDFRRKWNISPWTNVLDITHSVKRWEDSIQLAKAGLAVGARGIFCEVGSKRCDEDRSIPLNEFEHFVQILKG